MPFLVFARWPRAALVDLSSFVPWPRRAFHQVSLPPKEASFLSGSQQGRAAPRLISNMLLNQQNDLKGIPPPRMQETFSAVL